MMENFSVFPSLHVSAHWPIGQLYSHTIDPDLHKPAAFHSRDVKIPESGKIYSFNEGNYRLWNDDLRAYIEHVKDPAAHGGKPYSARYIGSLVRGVMGCACRCQ